MLHLPELKKFTILVDLQAFEGNAAAFASAELAQLAAKVEVAIEVTCEDPADLTYHQQLDYNTYLGDIREGIHEVLNPLVRSEKALVSKNEAEAVKPAVPIIAVMEGEVGDAAMAE